MPEKTPAVNEERLRLDSKKYYFLVEDTMPILNFELVSKGQEKQSLTLELHAPLSGEIFEARTPKGRIEVDSDGTISCFSTGESFTFSAFLGRNLSVTMNKATGEVILRTPCKIKSIEDKRTSVSTSEPFTDEVRLTLE